MGAKVGPAVRGNHAVTFAFDSQSAVDDSARPGVRATSSTGSDQPAIEAELIAVRARRAHIKGLPNGRDRSNSPLTGLANSGGGIRSASFGLGCLQGLQVAAGIDGIDYLSTVSGGGYVGCALTCASQKMTCGFPFVDEKTFADTASVRHIRDFSNYLIPRGGTDIVTAVGIILRGLVANAMIILPVILFLSWITVLSYASGVALTQPTILGWNLTAFFEAHTFLRPLLVLPGFWFTAILLVIDLLFLIVWVFRKSISISAVLNSQTGNSPELQGGLAAVSKFLFFLTAIVAVCELQPFLLWWAGFAQQQIANACTSCWSARLQSVIVTVTPFLAPLGAGIAFFSKYLGETVVAARRSSGFTAWLKKFLAKAAIWLGAIIVPWCLWLLYFTLAYVGIFHDDWLSGNASAVTIAAFSTWGGHSVSLRLLFDATVLTALSAFFVNPNATSLHRLYRDRLSKAFLFYPYDRDQHGDLKPLN